MMTGNDDFRIVALYALWLELECVFFDGFHNPAFDGFFSMLRLALVMVGGLATLGLVAGMLIVSYLLGQRHKERETGEPYEGGIVSEGSARVRLSMKFYLVAVFFVIFDLESVFIYAWAVAGRQLGWAGYGEVLVFIGVLGVTLGYLWRLGALDWNVKRRP